MSRTIWTRDTLLDVVVNMVPLGILIVFIALFLLRNPWGTTPVVIPLFTYGVILFTFAALAVLTYVAATVIETSAE